MAPSDRYAIYKPVRGERPLWDFPEGTLAGREVAAYEISRLAGWNLVPPTVLRDGPAGVGSFQHWVGDPFAGATDPDVVDVVPVDAVPTSWLGVFEGETPDGLEVTVVHRDVADVRSLAVLDAVLNNSDRKGSHCLRDDEGRLWGIDHGVSLHHEPKLRTVLWGWAGQPLPEPDQQRLHTLRHALATDEAQGRLRELLPHRDVEALRARVDQLARVGVHPHPQPGWPAVPWPPL